MPNLSGQLCAFNIYPEPRKKSRLFFKVRIFRSKAALQAYLHSHRHHYRSLGRYGLAMCSKWKVTRFRKNGRARTTPEMGEILFIRRQLRMGIIAHEVTHAALEWSLRVRLNPHEGAPTRRYRGEHRCSENEERFCYGLGEMARQVAVQIWERGYAD